MPKTDVILSRIQEVTTPEVFRRISAHLTEEAKSDTQNQVQNGLSAEMAKVKPAILREIVLGSITGEEYMDVQNQNQGKLEDLVAMKPEALRQLRVSLRGEEAMDNQNINQGSQAAIEEFGIKPQLP